MARLPTPLRPYWPQVKAASLRVTRGLAPLSVRLSRGFGQRALPRDSVTAPEYASETASLGRLRVARAAESVHRSAPNGYPPEHWAFRPYVDFRVGASSVLELHGGHALRDYGAVLTPDGRLVFDLSPYFGVTVPREHPIYWRPLLPPPRRVSAPVAVLAARGATSYYHFMFDILPRLTLLRDSGALDSHTRYYVSARLPWQRELLAAWEIPLDRVIDPALAPHIVAISW